VAQALRRRREEGVALGHRGRDRRGRLGPVLVGRRIPEDRRIVSDGAHGLVERLTDGRSLVVGDDDDGFPGATRKHCSTAVSAAFARSLDIPVDPRRRALVLPSLANLLYFEIQFHTQHARINRLITLDVVNFSLNLSKTLYCSPSDWDP